MPEVSSGCEQPLGIVTEQAEGGVAGVAKEASHLTRDVAVVDAQPLLGDRWSTADRADPLLTFLELLVLLQRGADSTQISVELLPRIALRAAASP
jgi:hypothetical protein